MSREKKTGSRAGNFKHFQYSKSLTLVGIVLMSTLLGCGIFSPRSDLYDYQPGFYDKAQAQQSIWDLKNGLLVVGIPTFRNKLKVLKSIRSRKEEHKETLELAEHVKKDYLASFSEYYTFGDYILLDDTLIAKYFGGEPVTMYREPTSTGNTYMLDTSQVHFRISYRNYTDDIILSYQDGSQIPKPMPSTSHRTSKDRFKSYETLIDKPMKRATDSNQEQILLSVMEKAVIGFNWKLLKYYKSITWDSPPDYHSE